MITYVSGKLVEKKPSVAVVDVQGLGYQVLIPTSTYDVLPQTGEAVVLYTHHYVREDAVLLYGFSGKPERALFEVLIGVSGVGPKLALAVLSAMAPAELRHNLMNGDASLLTNVPGIGRKTADRLVVELRDRVGRIDFGDGDGLPANGDGRYRTAARADALAALEQLGLARAQAEKNLRKVLRDHSAVESADEMVRLALREQA